jgi:hypothetical protein
MSATASAIVAKAAMRNVANLTRAFAPEIVSYAVGVSMIGASGSTR